MWGIVFGVTAVGPVCLVALHRVIAGPPEEEAARKAADAAARAAAAAEAAGAPAVASFSGGAVELAEAFLHGEFDEDRDGDELLAAAGAAPGTLRGMDPRNPFAA